MAINWYGDLLYNFIAFTVYSIKNLLHYIFGKGKGLKQDMS